MKTTPIVAANPGCSGPAAPRPGLLVGNGLPARWQGRARFAIMQIGFGPGHDFLATWAAWRDDPARCDRLVFVSIEPHPLRPVDLADEHAASPVPGLARQLVQAWPAATCNLHRCEFEGGRVVLLLAFGDVAAWAREVVASIDAFYLDGLATGGNQTSRSRSVFAMLARLAATGATATSCSDTPALRESLNEGLRGAGFEIDSVPTDNPRGMTRARFAPRFLARPPPGRMLPIAAPSHALVIGAGLAGALTARAIARRGIACELIDRHSEPAAEASGNPAGLFHGAVMGQDGPHARLLRASALASQALMREAIEAGCAGRVDGLLRLESKLTLEAMRSIVERQALPTDLVRAVDADEATRIGGLPIARPAWFYPAGGWIDPAGLVRHAIQTPLLLWRGGLAVARLLRIGTEWQAIDASGQVIASAPVVVLANADDALRIAGLPAAWLQRRRGQVSWTLQPAARAPRVPVASGGYVLALPDGRLLFGASNDGSAEPALREADHVGNRARAAALLGDAVGLQDGEALGGRVGWRATTADRLPLIGPAPDLDAARPARSDAARMQPRQAGLWLHTGLGSRGLTTAPLGAELIAAQISGAPWPLEADLADAIDPARWLLRRT